MGGKFSVEIQPPAVTITFLVVSETLWNFRGSQLMGLGCGQRDLHGGACGAGQAWQALSVRPSLGSCLLPVFLAFAASVHFGLFPFASGFFSP